MSLHKPIFRPLDEYTPGFHSGYYSFLAKRQRRGEALAAAQSALGCDIDTARRVCFITWLVEMGWLSDDPSTVPARGSIARPYGREAYYEKPGVVVEIGELSRRTMRAAKSGQGGRLKPGSDGPSD